MSNKHNSLLSKLALKGSLKIVADYFEFAINNILFQRGVYPPEDFQTVRKYGLPLLVTADDEVQEYIDRIMKQVRKWIYGQNIAKLVVVLISKSTAEIMERWEFSTEILEDGKNQEDRENGHFLEENKSKEESQKEIQMIIRQITALVSYLPILKEDEYTFNVLVHTDSKYEDTQIPHEWCDTNGNAMLIEGDVETVKFKSFSTNIHEVGSAVSYKLKE